jgi:hypothetical protein
MEPLVIVLVPGVLGGILVALLMLHVRLRSRLPARWRPLEPPSPGLINMAHIRVDGVGGLGMVAMATTVALFEPRIRLAMIIAVVLGVALGVVLIALRRAGPLSAGRHDPGAHAMLPFDVSRRQEQRARPPRLTRAAEPRRVRPAESAIEPCRLASNA